MIVRPRICGTCNFRPFYFAQNLFYLFPECEKKLLGLRFYRFATIADVSCFYVAVSTANIDKQLGEDPKRVIFDCINEYISLITNLAWACFNFPSNSCDICVLLYAKWTVEGSLGFFFPAASVGFFTQFGRWRSKDVYPNAFRTPCSFGPDACVR